MKTIMAGACRSLCRFVAAMLAIAAALGSASALAQSAAPPRSIADILAVLDQHKPDPAVVSLLHIEADRQPPRTDDRLDLGRFYQARGLAAEQLGRVNQALADLRKAFELLPRDDYDRWTVYVQVIRAERQAGDFAASVKMAKEIHSVHAVGGQRIFSWATVAYLSAEIGDLATARQAADRADGELLSLQSDRSWGRLNFNWRASAGAARGRILRLEGKNAEAELKFREAIALFDRQIEIYPAAAIQGLMPPLSAFVRAAGLMESGQLVPILIEQGKYAEAEESGRNALKRLLGFFGKYSPEGGSSLTWLATAVFEQGRFEEASALARAAVEIYEIIGAAPASETVVLARRMMAASLVEEGKYAAADAVFKQVREAQLSDPEMVERLGTGSVAWVYAQVRLGRTAEAVEQARKLHEALSKQYGETFYQVSESRGFLALALAADRKYDEAMREFRAALPALVAAANEQTSEEGLGLGKTNRLKRILEAYIALLGRYAAEGRSVEGIDPVAEAFWIADLARGSSVQRALVASSARAAIRDPELAKLAREEQDSAHRVSTLTRILVELLGRPPEQSLPAVIAAIRKDIEDLGKRRLVLKKEIESRFPDYANLINPKPIALDAVRGTLAPGETLIVLYGIEEQTFVWAVPPDGPARFHASALGRVDLDRLVATLRKALDIADTSIDDIPRFDVGIAHKLYTELLAPLEQTWGKAASLLVVPHGSLGQLPFSLFVTAAGKVADGGVPFEGNRSVAWLLRRLSLTQLPSVNTLASLRSSKRVKLPSKPFIGFGDPVFGPRQLASASSVAKRSLGLRSAPFTQAARLSSQLAQLAPLPDTSDELQGIARAVGASAAEDLFLGLRASELNVKTLDLSERRIVAFATHGLVAGDLDGLTQPALALSNPQMTGEKDADGLLAMDEILGLKLNADWVVLSACNTAAAAGAGGEAISGLGRAFFYAGARALLVSNWPVETISAKLLVTDVFRRQAADPRLSRAEALRQAMLNLMDNETSKDKDGKPHYSYAHPMFWAPFTLVGDGGR
jgi:CHAT domain-containing protein